MKKLIIAVGFVAPAIAFGQNNVDGLIETVGRWIASLTPIAFAAALLFFFYGLAMFILKEGDDKEKGKSTMIWGVIAIFVMSSVFGLVSFMQNTLNLQNTDSIDVPSVNGLNRGSAGGG